MLVLVVKKEACIQDIQHSALSTDNTATNNIASEEKSMDLGFKVRSVKDFSLLHLLRNRETFSSKPNTHHHIARKFYCHVLPNYTIIDVEKPPCFLRKFSSDGHYFVAFSSDQSSLEIYEFQGPGAAGDLLSGCTGDVLSEKTEKSAKIRQHIFHRFFKLKHTVVLGDGHEHLNRECSLFTDNNRYVIVGSAMTVPSESTPPFHEIYRNNESVPANEQRALLENYTLYIVDLELGICCDTRQFKCDKIFLSHNQGLYLYKNTLAVLSVLQQTIHIILVEESGKLQDIRSIGRFCYEDDQLYFSLGQETRTGLAFRERQTGNKAPLVNKKPYDEVAINSLKHRLLVHLFREAKQSGAYELRKFYRYFAQFRQLRMWKMQLVDESHLMIKYANEKTWTQSVQDPNTQLAFFVLYDFVNTSIIGVWENSSEELLSLFESFPDQFRNVLPLQGEGILCSATSNIHARQIQSRFKQTIINARYGGHTEAVKRILAQLPISAQSYSSSPYLDLTLFSYDDKWVSVMERPKTCGEFPVRFYDRESNLLKFKIHTGSSAEKSQNSMARRLVAFTFHPNMPFAISVQRKNSSQYIVNLHIHHVPS